MNIIKGKNVFTGEAVAVTLENDHIARMEPCESFRSAIYLARIFGHAGKMDIMAGL